MNNQKFLMSLAALALGTMISSAAFAQSYGRAANDGGYIPDPGTAATNQLYNSAPQSTNTAPHYGRPVNDGGLVDQPTAAQSAAAQVNQNATAQQPQHYGRPVDDGGPIQ